MLLLFCRETGLDIRDATLWTDATVVLSWIRSNPSGWKSFICNRSRKYIHIRRRHNGGIVLEKTTQQTTCLEAWMPISWKSWSHGGEERHGPQRATNSGRAIRALQSSRHPKKGKLLIRFYTSRLVHFCLTRQDTALIGIIARHDMDFTFRTEHPACSPIIRRTNSARAYSSTLTLDQSCPGRMLPSGVWRPPEKSRLTQRIENLSIQPVSRPGTHPSWRALTMRRPPRRRTPRTPAWRPTPLCSHVDLANTHTPPSPGSPDHSIRTQKRILDFVCTSSHKENAAQMSSMQDGEKPPWSTNWSSTSHRPDKTPETLLVHRNRHRRTLVFQGGEYHQDELHCSLYMCHYTCRPLGIMYWYDHWQVLVGLPAIRGKTRTATHCLHGQRPDLSCRQQTRGSTVALSVCSQDSPFPRSTQH